MGDLPRILEGMSIRGATGGWRDVLHVARAQRRAERARARAIARPDAALQLREALGVAVAHAAIDPSAVEIAAGLTPGVIAAMSEPLAETGLCATRVYGVRNPEERDWYQLVLAFKSEGPTGSPDWRRTLEALAAAMETAIDGHPGIARAIADEITFDF
jgi:hypothetical protein